MGCSQPPRAPLAFRSQQPNDIELTKVLHNRVHSSSGMPLPSPLIIVHEANVYAGNPDELTQQFEAAVAEDGAEVWYFFTELLRKNQRGKRMNRSTDSGAGVWHDEGKSKPVVVAGLGSMRRNSYSFQRKGPDGKQGRTGWLMREYQLEDGGKGQNLVLCKIYCVTRKEECMVRRSPRRKSSSSVVAPNGQALWAVAAALAAAKRLLEKVEAVMHVGAGIETADVTETAAFDAAKASVGIVENAIVAANKIVERVKDMLKAASVAVILPGIMEMVMASTKAAMASAMAVTKGTDLTCACRLAKTQADVTVMFVMAFETTEDKVAVLMAAEAAAEAAARAALVMVEAAMVQATKRKGAKGKAALDVLVAAVAAAEEAGNTVDATAFAVAAVGTSHEVLAAFAAAGTVTEMEIKATASRRSDVVSAAATVAMATSAESYRDGDGDNGIAPTAVAPETVVVASAATMAMARATESYSDGNSGIAPTTAAPETVVVAAATTVVMARAAECYSDIAPTTVVPETVVVAAAGGIVQTSQELTIIPPTPLADQRPTDGLCNSSPAPPFQRLADQPCHSRPASFVVPPQEEDDLMNLDWLFGNEVTNDGTPPTSEATTATESEWNLHSLERFLSDISE